MFIRRKRENRVIKKKKNGDGRKERKREVSV